MDTDWLPVLVLERNGMAESGQGDVESLSRGGFRCHLCHVTVANSEWAGSCTGSLQGAFCNREPP